MQNEIAAKRGMQYLARLPIGAAEIPRGHIVVHNHVQPKRRLGVGGFRAWLQTPGYGVQICPCGSASELGVHYRVRGIPERAHLTPARMTD
jgi:hypothetical protein